MSVSKIVTSLSIKEFERNLSTNPNFFIFIANIYATFKIKCKLLKCQPRSVKIDTKN